MCLIALAHRASERWPLVIAANRDEFFARPTRAAHWWDDAPGVYGGRDLRAGGSWMAVTRRGRFAMVTNVRGVGPAEGGPYTTSRGGPIENEVFVAVPEMGYGTRSSTVVLVGADGAIDFTERSGAGEARFRSPSPS